MTDDEVIDGEAVEVDNLPAVRSSGMLLAGTDARAKLENAKEIAVALSDVIEQQKLFAIISGKKHVLVEGWELLGSLLGVFPVVEWTRETANGWEARVVAKTLDGAEVGSAEMMCTRDETRWKTADDYAIRSMAQTRAVSKSLRAPLGFVMKLAGYEPTPEAEALTPGAPAEPKPFDPDTDLLPGAIQGQDVPKRLIAALDTFDPTVDWIMFISSVVFGKYDVPTTSDLKPKEFADFWRRLSNAVQWLTDHTPAGDFPPVDESMLIAAFVFSFGEDAIDTDPMPRKEIPTPEVLEEKEGAPLSEEQVTKIEESLADPADDPGFGYENPND